MKPSTESAVVKACLAYLHAKGVYAWRNNNKPVYDAKAGRCRKFSGLKGVADILGMVPEYWPESEAVDAELMACTGESALLAIECKAETGRLSDDQKAFRKNVLDRGGLYIVARSIDDLREAGL